MPGAAEALYKIKRPKSAETLRRAKIVRLQGTCVYPSLNGRTPLHPVNPASFRGHECLIQCHTGACRPLSSSSLAVSLH